MYGSHFSQFHSPSYGVPANKTCPNNIDDFIRPSDVDAKGEQVPWLSFEEFMAIAQQLPQPKPRLPKGWHKITLYFNTSFLLIAACVVILSITAIAAIRWHYSAPTDSYKTRVDAPPRSFGKQTPSLWKELGVDQ